MYSVTINEEHFSVQLDGDDFLINGNAIEWKINPIDNRRFHLLRNHQSHLVELVKLDKEQKELVLKINNKEAFVKVKDKFDLLLEKLGMNGQQAAQASSVTAPMPGLILEILVHEGEAVKKGQSLLILEAMKMENVLKSPGDGTVKSILISTGESVEKNQVLIQF